MTISERIERIFERESTIPAEWRTGPQLEQRSYLVGGKVRRWEGPSLQVVSPIWTPSASGPLPRIIGISPSLTKTESMAALDAAVAAYGGGRGAWPMLPMTRRVEYVRRFAFKLEEKRQEIVKLLMWETGKPLAESVNEYDRTIEYVGRSISAIERGPTCAATAVEEDALAEIRRAPVGVALCLGPYNFPLNETLDLAVPALLMGNTVVLKPPRFGVLLFGLLLEAFCDSFPPGVVNVIFGESEIVKPMMTCGKVDILGFVGSTQGADWLYALHPSPRRLRSVMGLEAKNPAIILPDADLELTVNECVEGALKFNGQRCTALKILFVHQTLVEAFLSNLVRSVEKLGFGLPWDEAVFLTPLPDAERVAYLQRLLDDAVRHGAEIVNEAGGTVHGSFFYPAILSPVNRNMRLYNEEQFGPLIPIVPFVDKEEPLSYIIESDYGQQVSIFGKGEDMAEWLDILSNQVCRVNVNKRCQRAPDSLPFAGRKGSGVGVRSVTETLRAFSMPTVVARA